MDMQKNVERIAGIMALGRLHYETSAEATSFRVLFETLGVFVRFHQAGVGVVVTVTSPIVSGIDADGAGAAAALNHLHRLNLEHRFLKFLLLDGELISVCDLLADHLHAAELLNAIYATAAAAEKLGTPLAEELGGRTFAAVLEAERADVSVDETSE